MMGLFESPSSEKKYTPPAPPAMSVAGIVVKSSKRRRDLRARKNSELEVQRLSNTKVVVFEKSVNEFGKNWNLAINIYRFSLPCLPPSHLSRCM